MGEDADKTVENSRVIGRPFVKGDPRINRQGRPPGSVSIIDELKRQLDEIADEDPQKRKKVVLLVKKILLKAINDGDTQMIRDIIDRVHGKATQPIDVNTDDEVWDKLGELEKQIKNE